MQYRTTAKGHRVTWDEPSSEMELRISDQIRKTLQDRKAKAARERLKAGSKVPKKSGKPMFERYAPCLSEDLNTSMSRFRQLFYSGKMMTFKQWLTTVSELIDEAL